MWTLFVCYESNVIGTDGWLGIRYSVFTATGANQTFKDQNWINRCQHFQIQWIKSTVIQNSEISICSLWCLSNYSVGYYVVKLKPLSTFVYLWV